MRKENRAAGAALASAGAFAFGMTVVLSRDLARAHLPPSSVLGVRFSIAAVALWLVLAVSRAPLLPKRGERLAAFLLGAVLYAVEATFFYVALEHGSAAAVTLLFYSYPAIITVVETASGTIRPGGRTVGALALSILGAGLVVSSGDRLNITGAGVGFALASAFTFGVYLIAGDRLTGRSDARAAGALVAAGAGAAHIVRVLLTSGIDIPLRYEPVVVANGLATAAAFALVFAALKRLRAADTSVILTLEAFWAGLLAWIFLAESVRPLQILGGLAIVGAVVVIATSPAPAARAAADRAATEAP